MGALGGGGYGGIESSGCSGAVQLTAGVHEKEGSLVDGLWWY